MRAAAALCTLMLLAAACTAETERVVARTSAPAATTAAARTSPAATTAPTPAPTAAPAASATATGTPRASATPAVSLPPMPPLPALPSGARSVASGTVSFTIDAGATRQFDPSALANGQGQTAPPCAQTVWTAAWRASEPLAAAWIRQTARTELGRGRWGSAELGCAALELRNDGSASVTGELQFAIGSR